MMGDGTCCHYCKRNGYLCICEDTVTAPNDAPKASPLGFGDHVRHKEHGHGVVTRVYKLSAQGSQWLRVEFNQDALAPQKVISGYDFDLRLERILPPDVSAELSAHKDLLDHVENSGLCSAPVHMIEESRAAIERCENGRSCGLSPDVQELVDAAKWMMSITVPRHLSIAEQQGYEKHAATIERFES